MKHLLLLASFLPFGIGLSAQAQPWCPLGAEWTFSYFSVDWGGTGETIEGSTHIQYIGDTLIAGQLSQYLQSQLHYQVNGEGDWISSGFGHLISYNTDDVVYLWNETATEFDTLLCFGLPPGGHWSAVGLPPEWQFTVLDTATVTIDGIPLRRSMVQLAGNFELPVDTLYERIGFAGLNTFGPASNVADGTFISLLCYHDTEIAYPDPEPVDCGFTVDVTEHALDRGVKLYPNPGHDLLTIDTGEKKPAEVRVLDGTGRLVLQASAPSGQLEVNSAHLSPGVYVVEVQGDHWLHKMTWIKQ